MPWAIREENGQHCVYKKTTGKTMKCYSDAGDAEAYLKALWANASEKELQEALDDIGSAYIVEKEDDGRYKVVTVSTVALKDREGETFDTSAIDYDVALAEKSGVYPEYRLFHKKDLAFGKVEKMRRVGIFAVDEGHSYADPFSISICEKMLANNDGKWRCSRGFYIVEASGGCPNCRADLLIGSKHMSVGFKCPSCNSVYIDHKGVLKDLHFRKARTFDVTVTDNPAVPWTGVTAYREFPFSEDTMTKKELRQKLLDAGLDEEVVDSRLKSITDAQLKEFADIPMAQVLKEFEPEHKDEDVVYEVDDAFMKELKDTVGETVKEVLDGFEINITDVGDLEVDMKEVPEIVAIGEAVNSLKAELKELKEAISLLLEKDDTRLKEMLDEMPRAGKLRIRRFKAAPPEDEEDMSDEEEDGEEELPPSKKKQLRGGVVIAGADGRYASSMTEFVTAQ